MIFSKHFENSGGGASSVLYYVGLTVIPNAECAAVYGTNTVVSTCMCTAADPSKSTCNVSVL
jgi:hypothetical protein